MFFQARGFCVSLFKFIMKCQFKNKFVVNLAKKYILMIQFFFVSEILNDQQKCDLQEVRYVQNVPGGPGVPVKSPMRELIRIRFV